MTPRDETRGDKLATALETLGVSKIELARRLAGAGATPKQVENMRRQVRAWSRQGANFNDATATRLEEALELPTDVLHSPRPPRRGTARAQLEEHVAELEEQVEELEVQVSALRGLLAPWAESVGLEVPEPLREAGPRASGAQ